MNNKGLEATKRLKWGYAITREERINLCESIEKELKQAEKDKEMLDIFKNALTIEHHETTELDHSQDANDYFVRELFTIKQNQIDIEMRKSLREWVLKNAFPKELKALEIIKEKNVDIQTLKRTNNVIEYNSYVAKGLGEKPLTQEEYELLREVLL